ncbi:MAG TPA: hypothetical protein VGR00_05385, partial [Thermoanaerobaculia bacterium]|nr:hypothetical protein [Thermoanaerobaculia bacterium]
AAYRHLARLGLIGRRVRRVDAAFLVGVPLYVLAIGNGRFLSSGDNTATRCAAGRILTAGTLDLRGLPEFRKEPPHYSTVRIGSRLLPSFPLGTALLSLPYRAAALAISRGKETLELRERWEKSFAALATAAAAVFLFLAVRRRFGDPAAFGVTFVFALATPAFSTSGQAMYSTTGEVFFLCLALFLLAGAEESRMVFAAAGLSFGAAFLCRPTALIPAAALALAFATTRLRAAALAAGAALSIGLSALWLKSLYGHPLGGYGLMNGGRSMWNVGSFTAFAGSLLSPSRGLIVFFPYLLFLAIEVPASDRFSRRLRFAALAAASGCFALASSYAKWWGGHGLGPRLMAEASPFLALLTLPIFASWPRLGPVRRWGFAAAVVFSAATQILLVYRAEPDEWNASVSVDENPGALWSLRGGQLAAAWLPRLEATALAAAEIEGSPTRWRRVDLSEAANARYDLDPFRADASEKSWPHYPRLDARRHDTPLSLFRFLPRERLNAVTTCRHATPAALTVPLVSCRALHAVLAAGATGGRRDTGAVAFWELRYEGGETERLPIRLNADAFEYHAEGRAAPVPPDRVYEGTAGDDDVLVRSTFVPLLQDRRLASIRLVGDPGSDAGVTVFAVTLER